MTRLLVLVLVLMLAGCGDAERERELAARVAVLEQALAEQQGQRQAELEAAARAASVAAACDWLVPTCPASIAEPGRAALAAGAAPADISLWLLVAKLALLVLPVGAAAGLSGWLWSRASAPALAEAARARALLAELAVRRDQAEAEVARAQALLRQRRGEVEQAQAELTELRAQADRLRADVARLEELRRLVGGL